MKKVKQFIVIAGPCVIESKKQTLAVASYLKELTAAYPVSFIFKASFDKANRTSLDSFRGPGLVKGLRILEAVKKKLEIPITSDVHTCRQVREVKDILDIIQIPAFLCRQTDLILEAAKTKKTINVKKGQFLAPDDVKFIIKKIESRGNRSIFITERGSCFGYNNLVVDFRSFLIMRKFGYPVIFDITHSLQRPSAASGVSGGDRQFACALGAAAVACGVDGIFLEVHPQPSRALSDKYTSLSFAQTKHLLSRLMRLRGVVGDE